jgi:dTDP-4-amino-4,6-dideoxygalactose transaminase
MRVPMLDLSQQYSLLAGAIRKEIEDVLTSQRFILGPKGAAFEEAIAAYCGALHAIGVSSGTDALLAVLMALKIGPGDVILTTPYSFFATAGCITRLGAAPRFVDIDRETYNISPAALRRYIDKFCGRPGGGKLLDQDGRTICAILPTHLFGLCCEMDQIMALAREYDLLVIEDAAQAIGAEYPSADGPKKAGTMGDTGCFSFYPSKNLGAAGDAGLIVCQDNELAERLRICRQHGMEPRYEHHFIGGNFRLDEMQAAILRVKLPHLVSWSAARRAAADFYREEFTRVGLTTKIALPAEPYRDHRLTNHHIYHQYVIRTPRRDELREHLAQREIETAIYYPIPLHEQECFKYLGYKPGDLPEAEQAARETLALPIYPEIPRDAQRFVVNAMVEFFG